jgi:transposase
MEAGKKRLTGDIVRQANTSEVTDMRRETRNLKEMVAEQTRELRLLKKSMLGDGGSSNEIPGLREA